MAQINRIQVSGGETPFELAFFLIKRIQGLQNGLFFFFFFFFLTFLIGGQEGRVIPGQKLFTIFQINGKLAVQRYHSTSTTVPQYIVLWYCTKYSDQ